MSLIIDAETNIEWEPCVVAWDNKLFVGTDSGHICSFDADLAPVAKWQAHSVQLFALAAAGGKVYSASNDGGVRVWSAEGDKVAELPVTDGDTATITVAGSNVYIGDEVGNITVYKDNTLTAKYNVLEEVKALAISLPYMFTARDLYITVTEIRPEESKDRFVTRHVIEGRAPLNITGSRLLGIARGGNNLQLHEISVESKFMKLDEVKVSDMILTSLTSSDNVCWTGGWDGYVRQWKIVGDKLQAAGEINHGVCVNALVATPSGYVYVLLTGGKITRIKVK